jgi:RNA polymerase-binding protein DksA
MPDQEVFMLSDEQLQDLEQQMRTRREQLMEEVRRKMKAAREPLSSDKSDVLIEDGDVASADLQSHLSLAESQRDVQEMQDIDDALQRMADGSYGRCVHCGGEIEPARLAVQPTALRCLRCQEDYERTYATTTTPTL